ncbi:hypothetical protein QAD02_009616 [Eretmocerus hayati]|uniref:Uncharacterized protein n=1 Tax=Eretmocerus hayati TaxID=131215 RepID=A0ACC2NB37_9HYME|nr:hypothetical protein QAD02_009616 [Eretmocerus hayati]
MSFSPTDYLPSKDLDPISPEELRPNPEEEKILKACREESIYKRAIPMGVMFGLGGLIGAKAGPFMHPKWGVKPAVFGFGLIGYVWGRATYAKVCIRRVLEVPDGNLRKLYEKRFPQYLEKYGVQPQQDPSVYYAEIEPQKRDVSNQYGFNSDIDIPTMTNLDTTPSEYRNLDDLSARDKIAPREQISYDDLRQQNRQQFSNRPYPGNPSQTQERLRRAPDNAPRPTEREAPFPESPGGRKTKYGDAWDE